MAKLLPALVITLTFVIFSRPAYAGIFLQQTEDYSLSLNVWQAFQEFGDNLNGELDSFTFRVKTDLPRGSQFDYTAQNTRIIDKTTNQTVAQGCATGPGSDKLRGLIFNQIGVPAGYEDVTIDFTCRNFSFIPGHKYLIFITNANNATYAGRRIRFGSAAYGSSGQDFFTGGGVRYAFDNAECSVFSYPWMYPSSIVGCNILTNKNDDLYFLLNSPPSPPPPEITPVILIPGIGGSELKTNTSVSWSKPDGHGGTFNYEYPAGEKVWVNEIQAALPGEDDYFDILRMQPNGITPEADLQLTGNLFPSAYQPTIDFLTSNGYTLNESLFIFPYDWRKDLSLVTPLLDQKIESIKSQTGSQKVDIIAHSMGGLLARSYISDISRANKVRKLIELGVPHLGSVKYLKYFMHGGCIIYEVGPFCFSIAPTEMKDVLQNLAGGFQLMPSLAYFNFYTGNNIAYPFPFKDETDVDNNGVKGELDYSEIKTLLTNLGYNTSLFNPAENFYNSLGSLDNLNGVDTTIISGSGIPTLGQIIEKNVLTLGGIKINKKDALFINGDKTVPLYSSSLDDSGRNISLKGPAKVFYTNQEHGSLIGNGPSMNLVKNILADNSQIPDGVLNQPYKINGTDLSVHSPLNIHVYDTNQNHTGPTESGFEENIPGSSYETLDDAKFIFLPESGEYLIKFEALDQGSFDFKIRKFENDENILSILYKNIPLESNTKAKAILNNNALEQTTLEIDENGDDIIDHIINPTATITGNENFDEIFPQVSIDANSKILWPPNNKMIDVEITGESFDINPYRNIFKVEDEYSLVEPTLTDFNQTIQLQASRREDDMDGRKYTIKVIAEDLAGNTKEAETQIIVPHDQRDKN